MSLEKMPGLESEVTRFSSLKEVQPTYVQKTALKQSQKRLKLAEEKLNPFDLNSGSTLASRETPTLMITKPQASEHSVPKTDVARSPARPKDLAMSSTSDMVQFDDSPPEMKEEVKIESDCSLVQFDDGSIVIHDSPQNVRALVSCSNENPLNMSGTSEKENILIRESFKQEADSPELDESIVDDDFSEQAKGLTGHVGTYRLSFKRPFADHTEN